MINYIKHLISLIKKKNKNVISLPVENHDANEVLHKKSAAIITSHDIRAIAGGDVMITQLDLARAYIELGKKNLAKKILHHVLHHGNLEHKHAAEQLMINL